MSMAMALEFTAEYLMERNGWTNNQVGVQLDAMPPSSAGPWYIALDDAGVDTGDDATDSLKEVLTITIGIWRKAEHLLSDRKGILKLVKDKYLLGSWTIHELERAVVAHKTAAGLVVKHGIHNNWSLVSGLNTRYNLPNLELGANFTQPWRYKGRGRMESIGFPGPDNNPTAATVFFGYRLRFHGLHREQKQRRDEDAIG